MTRLLFDKFAKDYLDRFLGPYGEFIGAREITSEILEIDGWFIPNSEKIADLHRDLGLLGRMAARCALRSASSARSAHRTGLYLSHSAIQSRLTKSALVG